MKKFKVLGWSVTVDTASQVWLRGYGMTFVIDIPGKV